jgi:hypothetical protein
MSRSVPLAPWLKRRRNVAVVEETSGSGLSPPNLPSLAPRFCAPARGKWLRFQAQEPAYGAIGRTAGIMGLRRPKVN